MKTLINKQFIMLIILYYPLLGECQYDNHQSLKSTSFNVDSTANINSNHAGTMLWGEFNAGLSNFGVAGSLTLNLRKGKYLFSTRYYKSHTCYKDDKKREYFLNDEQSDDHMTVEAISIFTGLIFPGKINPALTIGISLSQFRYVNTSSIDHNVTLPRIWDTIIDRDYTNETISTKTINSIGIPVGLKMHLNSKHFTGIDAGLNADLNLHRAYFSAEIGIRFGRINRRHN